MKNGLILFFGFLATALILFKPPIDPDLGWHLRNGQMIMQGWGLADFDRYTHTYSGYFFPNFSWLSDIFLYLGHQAIGLAGLAIFFAILSAAAIYLSCSPLLKNPVSAAIAAFFTALLLQPVLGVRAQTISFALFAVLWWMINKNLSARAERLGFFALFLFWANLHPGFLLGLPVLWYWKILRKDFIAPILATFATLFNPYGLWLYTPTLSHLFYTEKQNQIAEWFSPDFHSLFGLFLFGYLTILIVVAAKNLQDKFFFPLLAGFIFLALSSVRYVQFLPVIGNGLILGLKTRLRYPPFVSFYRSYLFLFFPLFFFIGALSLGQGNLRVILAPEKLAERARYPYGAVEYLRQNPPAGNGFNPYGWGGYLVWNLPQKQVFLDGRTNSWHKADSVLLDEYSKIYSLKFDWENLLNKYKVSWVLAEPESSLASGLRLRQNWQIVFEDKVSVVFDKIDSFYSLTKKPRR